MEIKKGFDLIGDDCKQIIFDYYYELVITEKFNKCIEDIKKIKHTIIYDDREDYYYSRIECKEKIFTDYTRVCEVYDNCFKFVDYCYEEDTLSTHNDEFDTFYEKY